MSNRRIYGRSEVIRVWHFACEFPRFVKMADGLFKFRCRGRHVGSSDVYDRSARSINHNRIPGSRVRNDKNNDRKGKWTGWKCQRELNCAELRETNGEIDNRNAQVGFGNDGEYEYQDNWGVRKVMYGAQAKRLIPKVIGNGGK